MSIPDPVDIDAWIRMRVVTAHPQGIGGQVVGIPVFQMLQRQHDLIDDDLNQATSWYFYVGDLLELVVSARAVTDRRKSATFAELKDQVRQAMVEDGEKVTNDAVEARARHHADYLAVCSELIAMEEEERRLRRLLEAVDKRIDSLRTISANRRQEMRHSDPATRSTTQA